MVSRRNDVPDPILTRTCRIPLAAGQVRQRGAGGETSLSVVHPSEHRKPEIPQLRAFMHFDNAMNDSTCPTIADNVHIKTADHGKSTEHAVSDPGIIIAEDPAT